VGRLKGAGRDRPDWASRMCSLYLCKVLCVYVSMYVCMCVCMSAYNSGTDRAIAFKFSG